VAFVSIDVKRAKIGTGFVGHKKNIQEGAGPIGSKFSGHFPHPANATLPPLVVNVGWRTAYLPHDASLAYARFLLAVLVTIIPPKIENFL
jgi:hypothetical protein